MTPHRVTSSDGTPIAWYTSGTGHPAVFVHGTTADHTSWDRLVPYLDTRLELCAMDRRGRGGSGDTLPYSVQREFEDVAAVVDAVAERAGGPVGLFGHSYGAVCALGAATLTGNVSRLVLYEPYLHPDEQAAPDGMIEQLEELLDRGDREAVLTTFYRLGLGMNDDELALYTGLPSWPNRVAAAHTVPRELRAEETGFFDIHRLAGLPTPTLLLVGGLSRPFVHDDARSIVDAVANGEVQILEGHEHVAHYVDPALVAGRISAWLLPQDSA